MAAMSEKYQIDITCIQEHRIHHPKEMVRHQDSSNGSIIITGSAEKAESNSTIRGVGMLVSPRAHGSLLNVELVSSRIMVATFNGNPKTTLSSCYSPTNYSDEIEAVESYSMLQDVIRQLPKHNVIIITGDMIAQVGSEDIVGFSFHDKKNRNDNLPLGLTKECELVSISTKVQKKKGKLWTHIPMVKEHNSTISSSTKSGKAV